MSTRYGTAYFASLAAAVSYYARQDIPREDVQKKLEEGEIFIGKPAAPAGSTVTLDTSEGRYFIEESQSRATPKRMWINQPSTSQPYHSLHGTHVLAMPEHAFICQVFFLSGDIVSQQMPVLALSDGWPRVKS